MTLHKRTTVKLAAAILLLAGAFVLIPSFAQPPASNRGLAKLDLGGDKTISIDYGRPDLKGRDLNAALKVGEVWRLGMNQATVLKSDVDIYACCGVIKKGNYSLWAKKTAENKYELIFNSQTGQWGTLHDPKKDVISVPLKVEASKDPVDKFTVTLAKKGDDAEARFAWGKETLVMEFKAGK
ncbi:MAG: DUF2911 domain-containing protein [Acidobacteriia bacterium]|nr:DUF2911 domain-containing protein [Terriglobia bacterium]